MKYLKTLAAFAVTILLSSQMLLAQGQQRPDVPAPDEVSDQELTLFASILQDLEPIQQELQNDIQGVVESEDMNMERFQEILVAMQNPQMADQAEITDEEQEKIGKMQPKVMELQMGAQEKMVNTIEDNGLEVQRYQQIIMGVQQHQELAQRLQKVMGEEDEADSNQ
jgi:hypothetical protein